MKKLLGVLVAIAMSVCLCIPAFALDSLGSIGDSLGDLDLSNFDISAITDGLDLDGIKDTISGLIGGGTGDSGSGAIADFDPTGALSSFVESLTGGELSELFSGLTDALGSLGISLPSGGEGGFDISGILGGNSGDGAGVASIMDTFGGVLESLGLDSAVIESLGQSDIVNFFANLYMGSVPTPEETTTEKAPTTTTTKPHNPQMGVNDGAAVVAACATLSVAAAAVYVCTRKKHA